MGNLDPNKLLANLGSLSNEDLDAVLDMATELSKNSLLDYIPHNKQREFHCAPHKIRFLCGGNRSGKTEAGVWEDVAHATGRYPAWYPEEKRIKTANRGRVVVTDFVKGGAVYEQKLWKYLPKDMVKSIKRTMKGALERVDIHHVSGQISSLEIMTHEQDDMVFESWSGHWVHFDEPPPRNKFIASMRGLIDYAGRAWLTLTPISQPWMYDEFIAKENDSVFYISVDMRDNPHLSEKEIEEFEAMLTEDEKESRLHGKFRHLTGLVYKEFDPVVHLVPECKRQSFWPVYFVLDPHDRRKHCGIWATVDPHGVIYVIHEFHYGGTIKDTSKEILKRELMFKIDPQRVIRILDPNKGRTPTAATGLRLVDEFAKYSLYFNTTVNDDIATGHLAVAEKLHYDKKKPLEFTNRPKLYLVRGETTETVRMLQTYVWDDWKSSEKEKKEKPKDVNKDFPDCVRYLVMSNPLFFTPDDERDPIDQQESRLGW